MHVAVSGWLLGEPSGANRRLLAILAQAAPRLTAAERITVLHRPGWAPPALGERIAWQAVPIAPMPLHRRIGDERRHLAGILHGIGANVLDHGLLPLPDVGIPACLLLHDLRAADGLTRWPRWFARRIVRRSCARAAVVVVPSSFTAARLRAIAPQCDPLVIANGVEPAKATRRSAPSDVNGYLLHIGHLEPRKNIDIVLRALARIPAARRPDLELVGRDAGSERRLARLVRKLDLGTRVRFRGVLADDQIHALYAGARAVVVPSVYEGFGLCALEGLAFGRPTLVADAGALPEVVGDAGTVLPATDAAAWAAAIESTARDEVGAVAQRRARAAASTWSSAADLTLATWRRLAATATISARKS
ncbi:MAG: glycosyltransferase [Planctomycetes bacterium]|nr:glycosyltransferase [Planctomycetota bacterium]